MGGGVGYDHLANLIGPLGALKLRALSQLGALRAYS